MKKYVHMLLLLIAPLLGRAQQHLPDTIIQALKIASNDSLHYQANMRAYFYFEELNKDSAIYYCDKTLLLAKKNDKQLAIARALASKGYQLTGKGMYAEALNNLSQAFAIAGDKKNASNSWFPNPQSSSEKNRLLMLSLIHHMYGLLMIATQNSEQEIFHFKEAKRIAQEINNVPRIMLADMNLGVAYILLHRIDSASIFLNEARYLTLKFGPKKYLGYIYANLGDIALMKADKIKAKQLFYQGLNIAIQQNNQTSAARIYLRLTDFYLAESQKDSSLYFAKKMLESSKTLGMNGLTLNLGIAYQKLYLSYKLRGQVDSSFKYSGLAIIAKDSINKEIIANIAHFQSLSLKEQLRLQNLEKEKVLYQSKLRTYALLTGLCVFLIIGLILWRNNKKQKHTNQLLSEQKEEISAQRDNLGHQNRELEIDASLERVRTVAMGMRKRDDLLDICRAMFEELQTLGFDELRNAMINILDDEYGSFLDYDYNDTGGATITRFMYDSHPFMTYQVEMTRADSDAFIEFVFEGQELQDFKAFKVENGEDPDPRLDNASALCYYFYSIGIGSVGVSTFSSLPEEKREVLKRFRNVCDLAYRRYADIELAEAQAKEAQVEVALERVRSRSMGMQKSDELKEVIQIVYDQFIHLNIGIDHAGFVVDYKAGADWHFWVADQLGSPAKLTIANYDCEWNNQFDEAKEKGINFFATKLDFEEKNKFYRDLFAHAPGIPDQEKELIFSKPALAGSTVLLEDVALYIENYAGTPYTDGENATLMRFGKVFQQTYTRFLDLQKAEAQAREAQIENVLEKVRSRSLAMHKTSELQELVILVFQKLKELGVGLNSAGAIIVTFKEGSKDVVHWLAAPDFSLAIRNEVPYFENPINRLLWESREKGEEFFSKTYSYEETYSFHKYLFEHTDYKLFPDEVKNWVLAGESYTHAIAFQKHSIIYLYTFDNTPYSREEIETLKRFSKVFEQSYVRFLDLQKAEAQAREAQIQLALERVRARTMAMQHSDELADAASLLFQQVQSLGVSSWSCGYNIWEEGDKTYTSWMSNKGQLQPPFEIPLTEHATFIRFQESRDRGESFWLEESGGEALAARYQYLTSLPGVEKLTEKNAQSGISLPEFEIMHVANFSHGNLLFITYEPVPEAHDIFIRFAAVFDQTYTRFLDLQKAEAQVREAQIEAALEKVRSRSLAMHQTEELREVVSVVFNKLHDLGIVMGEAAASIVIFTEGTKDLTLWNAIPDQLYSKSFHIPYYNTAVITSLLDAKGKGDDFFERNYTAEEKRHFWRWALEYSGYKDIPDERKKRILEAKYFACSVAYTKNSAILVSSYQGKLLSEKEAEVLKRFARVFEQAFVRFLDLRKAEAQAREGQIQLALERVRARTMAMQHSNELSETVFILFQQFKELGENPDQATIGIINEEEQVIEFWVTMHGSQDNRVFKFPIDEPYVTNKIYKGWKEQKKSLVIDLAGKELLDFMTFRAGLGGAAVNKAEKRRIINVAFFSKGLINVQSKEEGSEESVRLLERFAGVFDGTYTRFLDLKQAEAQAKEARVEASLERVRSKTMAMHNSQDVADTVVSMFDELVGLGLDPAVRSGIGIIDSSKIMELWTAFSKPDGTVTLDIGHVDMTIHPLILHAYKGWENKESAVSYELIDEDVRSYFKALNDAPDYNINRPLDNLPPRWYNDCFFFPEGCLFVFGGEPLSADIAQLFKRFAGVFGLTYRRYLDLQKAEAQAREAKIEAGLERVRSRTMAMQASDELAETAAVVFKQLIGLGIEPNRLFIGIINDDNKDIELWATEEDGSKLSTRFTGNGDRNQSIKKMYEGWKNQERSITIDMQGKELEDYFHYLSEELKVPFKLGLSQKRRIQSIAYFSKGFIGMASPDEQPEDTLKLLERFAGVFNLTFVRFHDLKIAEAHAIQAEQDLVLLQTEKRRAEDALTELKSTQTQLIQSEKMASLGELTAGIAHEIQNPLNFVNNFSEVSVELLQELIEEAEAGNKADVIAIAEDLTQNLQKINHHGKRADSIVKGMLEHSRVGTGQRQPTDLNVLADEFFKLSYHGLRAKDKTFNVELMTHFDTKLPKANVVQQDIGRVLINLFNNAFYAVNQRSKSSNPAYKPTVEVSTSTKNGQIEIRVKDNGMGMPEPIKEKIMQPFFTTKPTGEGTGLGLSLSYDIIVKGHGGSIVIDTKEGEYTEFTVILPLS